MDELIQSTCAVKWYSVFHREEILTHVTKWMNPEATALSEISESLRKIQILYDSPYMSSLQWSSSQSQKEWRVPGTGAGGGGG